MDSGSAPNNPVITNLDSLLHDMYLRYVQVKEFSLHYKVFDAVFNDLLQKMKEVDPYFQKYSSTVQFAGSHSDNLRIVKADEFDMDIVIGLPVNIELDRTNPARSDIIIEPRAPEFLQLKMGKQFQHLNFIPEKTAFEWMDNRKFLLSSKFIEWFESVVKKALKTYAVRNNSRPIVVDDDVPYDIEVSRCGPAMTLLIRNSEKNFKMDVDLVPALKLPESRWPISKAYRAIPAKCSTGYWMVVPKPKKSLTKADELRSWRIALHNQERKYMYDSNNLRQAIRLMKKLRDSQDMEKITSNCIKTLFYWEIVEINNEEYWRSSPAILFKRMVGKLHKALVDGEISYFWNKKKNIIAGTTKDILTNYAKKLEPFMRTLEDPSQYKLVAKYLLNPKEFADYNAKYLHIPISFI